MNPEDYGGIACLLRRPDIERQAIFGCLREAIEIEVLRRERRLDATCAELCRISQALPVRGRARGLPAPLADWRCGVGDATVYSDSALPDTLEPALRNLDCRRLACRWKAGAGCESERECQRGSSVRAVNGHSTAASRRSRKARVVRAAAPAETQRASSSST